MTTPWTGHALARELDTALAAVREAGLLCREVQASLDLGALQKKDRSPVTVADFGSQALVCRALGEVFPDDPVIERGDLLEKWKLECVKPRLDPDRITRTGWAGPVRADHAARRA